MLAAAVAGLLVAWYALSAAVVAWQARHIPGPFPLPFVGHVPYLLGKPWETFHRFARRYGGVYKLWVWNKVFVVVSEPALVADVLSTKRAKYPKDQWSYEYFR